MEIRPGILDLMSHDVVFTTVRGSEDPGTRSALVVGRPN
jgi:hypothetical protein